MISGRRFLRRPQGTGPALKPALGEHCLHLTAGDGQEKAQTQASFWIDKRKVRKLPTTSLFSE